MARLKSTERGGEYMTGNLLLFNRTEDDSCHFEMTGEEKGEGWASFGASCQYRRDYFALKNHAGNSRLNV